MGRGQEKKPAEIVCKEAIGRKTNGGAVRRGAKEKAARVKDSV